MSLALLEDEADDATYRQLEINLAAAIHGTREAIRRMKPRGTGHPRSTWPPVAGKVGTPGGATYCTTKHAIVGLSRARSASNCTAPVSR